VGFIGLRRKFRKLPEARIEKKEIFELHATLQAPPRNIPITPPPFPPDESPIEGPFWYSFCNITDAIGEIFGAVFEDANLACLT
jgi:hypothetical protein